VSWPLVKLGELIKVKGGKRLPKGSQYSEIKTPFAYIRVTDFENHSVRLNKLVYIDADIQDKISRYIISNEDVYISIAGTIGLVGIIPKELEGSNLTENAAKLVINDQEKLDKNYLMRFLATAGQAQLHQKKKTTSQPKLALFRIEEVEIPLPPLAEQKRIAAILDKADNIRQKRKQAIKLADDFLRSVFLDMFGDPVTNPKGWDIGTLKDHICNANNGLSRRRKTEENIGDIVLRLQDVHYDGIRYDKELNRIALVSKEKAKFELHYGDLLFIRVNGNPDYVGRSAVFDTHNEPVYHNDHLIRIKLKESYNSKFLSYTFNLPAGRKIISSQTKTSAGQHTISQGGIESLEFYLPPIDLQDKFVKIQKAVELLLSNNMLSGKKIANCFNSLSQKAFAGDL